MKNEFIEEIANNIIEALENGTAPFVKKWKGVDLFNTIPRNAITHKKYSGFNALNLWGKTIRNNYEDPRYLTFKQAQSIGANVRKGEKATKIVFYGFHKLIDKLDENGKPILDENGKKEKIKVILEKPIISVASVFNIKQCENVPKEYENAEEFEKLKKINFNPIQEAEEILINSKAVIEHNKGDRAYYSPRQDKIVLPLPELFVSNVDYYSAALHELCHWTGHESRLNRQLNNPNSQFGSQEYAKEELRAEIGSFMLCSKLALDYDPSNHFAYIDSWVKILKDTPSEILQATSQANKIVNYISEFSPLLKKKAMEEEKANEVEQDKKISLKDELKKSVKLTKIKKDEPQEQKNYLER